MEQWNTTRKCWLLSEIFPINYWNTYFAYSNFKLLTHNAEYSVNYDYSLVFFMKMLNYTVKKWYRFHSGVQHSEKDIITSKDGKEIFVRSDGLPREFANGIEKKAIQHDSSD